jgi:hypothetical protein
MNGRGEREDGREGQDGGGAADALRGHLSSPLAVGRPGAAMAPPPAARNIEVLPGLSSADYPPEPLPWAALGLGGGDAAPEQPPVGSIAMPHFSMADAGPEVSPRSAHKRAIRSTTDSNQPGPAARSQPTA